MTKRSAIQSENLDRFIRVMSRVLGIPRRKLDKMMFRGLERPPGSHRRSIAPRNSQSSKLSLK